MASVEYLVNLDAAQAAWVGALGLGLQSAPFDRLTWWHALHQLCLPGEEPLLALASAGEARCAMALMRRPGSKQLRSLANWYSFWNRPVFAGGGEALLPELAHDLARHGWRISLAPIAADDAARVGAAFAAAGWSVRAERSDVNHRVELGGRSFAQYWADRPGRLRETVRRKGGKGTVSLRVAEHFDPADWADYEAVYARSWKPEEGSPAFLRRFAEAEGAADRLRLGLAFIDGQPVAAQLWSVESGTAYIHKLAHAESAKAHSPGTLLSHALFAHAIDRDRVQTIDFGTGDDPYKRDWMEEVRPMLHLDMHRPRDPRSWPHLLRAGLKGPGFPLPHCTMTVRPRPNSKGPPEMRHSEAQQGVQVTRDETDVRLRAILGDVLGLQSAQVGAFGSDTALFGALPELDSMAVAGLLTEMEDRLDIVIDDDEVDGELLETYGNLLAFAKAKLPK